MYNIRAARHAPLRIISITPSMFTNVSKAGTGLVGIVLIPLLVTLLEYVGVVNAEQEVARVVQAIGQIVAFALLVWGQLDRADLQFGLFRK